ncbi:MAG: bestrophin family protein [Bacteroidota bacterium]|jgi:putative membrane protein
MVYYNPKDWFYTLFRFHKSDTFRKLFPLMIIIGLYSAGVAWLELSYWQLSSNSNVRNLTILHTLLGFAISMLLVFRTNTAYDRWWEGRKLWGSLVNSTRNLSMKLNQLLPAEQHEQRKIFRELIPAFAQALHQHLRKETTGTELFEADRLHPGFKPLDPQKHIPNQIASLIYQQVGHMMQNGQLSQEQLLYLNVELQSLPDVCGACERIKNTPIPFSYNVFIKKFIFIYIMTLPIGFVFQLGYWIIPIVIFVFYVLASLELIAEEIEDPFGGDANDIPTELIASNIRKHTQEILHP